MLKPNRHLIHANDVGQRLDNFLLKNLKGVPKSRIYKAIRQGEVRINGKRCKAFDRLETGDEVRVPPLRQSEEKPKVLPTKYWEETLLNAVLYEDDSLLVLNKPVGLPVHGGTGLDFGLVELLQVLKPEWSTIELVHRLDKDTSGVLLLAKKRSALKALHELLRQGEIDKRYQLIVKGYWLEAPKSVNFPLLRYLLPNGERMVKVHAEGKPSTTVFTPLKHVGHRLSLMEAKLLTGRTHQIRVHAQACGHPIIGDPKYGDDALNQKMKAAGCDRLFLHAWRVQLKFNEQSFVFEAPLPAVFEQLLNLS